VDNNSTFPATTGPLRSHPGHLPQPAIPKEDPNHVIFARCPALNLQSYVEATGMDHGPVHDGVAERPVFTYVLSTSPKTPSHTSSRLAAASRLMRSPWTEMSTQHEWLHSLELATQNLIGRHISTQQYSHIAELVSSRLQPDEKPVSGSTCSPCWLAASPATRQVAPTGCDWCPEDTVQSALPYRFPKSKSQSGQPSRTDYDQQPH
jgi:hypothetical protein